MTAVLASIDWRFKTVCWLQGLPGAFQKSDRFAARARRRGEQRRNGAGLEHCGGDDRPQVGQARIPARRLIRLNRRTKPRCIPQEGFVTSPCGPCPSRHNGYEHTALFVDLGSRITVFICFKWPMNLRRPTVDLDFACFKLNGWAQPSKNFRQIRTHSFAACQFLPTPLPFASPAFLSSA